MGIFNDLMELLDMGQRVASGHGEVVLREIRGAASSPATAQGADGAPPPARCDRAPAGFRCAGTHAPDGRCLVLEQIPAP